MRVIPKNKNIRRSAVGLWTILALALFGPLLARAAEPRIALVIGNSAYPSGRLVNPANDADLVSQTLQKFGFDVIERQNADQRAMKRAIQEFGERLEKAGPAAVGLFYYAGHGVQLSGRNYLIPTTAEIEREGDVEIEAVSADWVVDQMRYARNRLNLVILDACRNNPFTRGLRSADRGLATMQASAGVLIAYSTAPGDVAEDGSGRNSPYTLALARAVHVYEPVEEVFKQVRVEVIKATGGKQTPWEASSLTEDFYFPPAPAVKTTNTPTLQPPTQPVPATSGWSETLWTWASGLFRSDTAPSAAPPAILASGTKVVRLFRELGIENSALDASHDYALDVVRGMLEKNPRRVTLGSTPEQIRAALALCRGYSSDCRSQDYADETLRVVTLRPFEVDSVPVSVTAFRQFAEASHYRTHAERVGFAYAVQPGGDHNEQRIAGGSWRNGVGRRAVEDDAAVVGVSFDDATAYCLSKGSRLPTEDEWEYAARGPQDNLFPWGNDYQPPTRSMNIAPRVTDGPSEGIAGQFKGLSGNVWQWVDTPGVETPHGATRVLKGGSWLEGNPANIRAATRRYELPDRADRDSGFRCARAVSEWPDAGYWLAQLR